MLRHGRSAGHGERVERAGAGANEHIGAGGNECSQNYAASERQAGAERRGATGLSVVRGCARGRGPVGNKKLRWLCVQRVGFAEMQGSSVPI